MQPIGMRLLIQRDKTGELDIRMNSFQKYFIEVRLLLLQG